MCVCREGRERPSRPSSPKPPSFYRRFVCCGNSPLPSTRAAAVLAYIESGTTRSLSPSLSALTQQSGVRDISTLSPLSLLCPFDRTPLPCPLFPLATVPSVSAGIALQLCPELDELGIALFRSSETLAET